MQKIQKKYRQYNGIINGINIMKIKEIKTKKRLFSKK